MPRGYDDKYVDEFGNIGQIECACFWGKLRSEKIHHLLTWMLSHDIFVHPYFCRSKPIGPR